MTLRAWLLIASASVTLIASPVPTALAQDSCAAIADATKRLECFDRPPKAKPRSDPEILKAQAAVRSKLRDPDSTRFEALEIRKIIGSDGKQSEVLCGRLNSKNSFGGYTGFRSFAFLIGLDSLHILGEGSDATNYLASVIVPRACGGQ